MIITSTLFFLFGIVCRGELSGFIFNDNKSSRRYIHENGELSYEISNWPNKLGCCFSVFIDFNRYSSIIPLLDFRLNKYQSTRLSQGKLFKTRFHSLRSSSHNKFLKLNKKQIIKGRVQKKIKSIMENSIQGPETRPFFENFL